MLNAEVKFEFYTVEFSMSFSIQHSPFSICRVADGDAAHRDPEKPAAHVSDCLALLPSGPDAVRRLRLHRFRAAVRRARLGCRALTHGILSVYLARQVAASRTDQDCLSISAGSIRSARRAGPSAAAVAASSRMTTADTIEIGSWPLTP
jgi:hypothetical protein